MSTKNKSFQGRDTFSRMNFLYQASVLMAGKNDVLSCYYGNMCRNIGKKAVLRLEPSIKRTLCKKCCLLQKPGITAEIEASSEGNNNSQASIQIICKRCITRKNFIINPNYHFWLDDPESVADVFSLKRNKKKKRNKKRSKKGRDVKHSNTDSQKQIINT